MNRKVFGISILASIAATAYFYSSPFPNYSGMYENEYTATSATAASRTTASDYLKRQARNGAAIYSVDGDVATTQGKARVADRVIKNRRSGVRSNAFIYSKASSVTTGLNAYQASVVDSAKFDLVLSEIEPYRTGDYAGFYSTVKSVSAWAKSKGIKSGIYMGWPNDSCWSFIVQQSDFIFLHCYVQPSVIATGVGQFTYMKSRLTTIAAKAKQQNKKIVVVPIYSCEPDFSYNYFASHSWEDPLKLFIPYYQTNATADMKNFISIGGSIIFVSKYAKQLKP